MNLFDFLPFYKNHKKYQDIRFRINDRLRDLDSRILTRVKLANETDDLSEKEFQVKAIYLYLVEQHSLLFAIKDLYEYDSLFSDYDNFDLHSEYSIIKHSILSKTTNY